MQITSMSNRELLKTLTGINYPGVSEEVRQLVDPSSGSASAAKTNKDRFESSDSAVYEKSENGAKNTDRFEHSGDEDIDFNDECVSFYIQSRTLASLTLGMDNGIPTKERIAEYYGRIAKRLDEAYAAGKFTKEEYDYLNAGIAERMEHSTACAEDTAARRAVGHKNSMSFETFKRHASMTREELHEEIEAEVSEYIERFFKIDRKALMELFNNVRYGKQEKPTEKAFLL
ncbi:hypothetical protein HDR66_00275 [bacterium]|nr:hypothetical protein [bacterium]